MDKYYMVTLLVGPIDASDWSEGADETFNVARAVDAVTGQEMTGYASVSKETYDSIQRVLTPEGGV